MKKVIYTFHGMFGNSLQLKIIQKHLENLGHKVIPLNYHCNQNFEKLTKELIKKINQNNNEGASIIAFSFGNIIARNILSQSCSPFDTKTTKLIQIAPPNSGSVMARKIGKNPILRNSLLYSSLKSYDFENDNLVNQLMDQSSDYWKYSDEFKIPKEVELYIIKGKIPNYLNPVLFPYENDGTIADVDLEIENEFEMETVIGQHSMILYREEMRKKIENILKK
eukprot:gene7411-11734_t